MYTCTAFNVKLTTYGTNIYSSTCKQSCYWCLLKYVIHAYAVFETRPNSPYKRPHKSGKRSYSYVKKTFKTQNSRIPIDPAIFAATRDQKQETFCLTLIHTVLFGRSQTSAQHFGVSQGVVANPNSLLLHRGQAVVATKWVLKLLYYALCIKTIEVIE